MCLHCWFDRAKVGIMTRFVLEVYELLCFLKVHQQFQCESQPIATQLISNYQHYKAVSLFVSFVWFSNTNIIIVFLYMSNKCALVRSTSAFVVSRAKHVRINEERLRALAEQFHFKPFNADSFHQTQVHPQLALLQLFVLDCMNFCFWPLPSFEYDHLATHVQQAINQGIHLKDLQTFTGVDVVSRLFHGIQVPMADQRARILREMSGTVLRQFGGLFTNVITAAEGSAVKLLGVLTQYFPNFQDHSIYEGHQVHFYKRGQILIGDIYGKFEGEGLGAFSDIDQLTMFPDYRVPQILQTEGVFEYSEHLRQIIHSKTEITDRYLECELRASSVIAVEKIKEYLHSIGKTNVKSCQVDWFLWQLGESRLQSLYPHHRCLTIYY